MTVSTPPLDGMPVHQLPPALSFLVHMHAPGRREHDIMSPVRGPFLQRPDNVTGPKSHFEIKVSRKVECVLTSNEFHFVSLANSFTV